MRSPTQLVLAAALAAGGAALAATAPDYPDADLGRAARANVTHRWAMRGVGGGTTRFQVLGGDCFYGLDYFSAYVFGERTRPTAGTDTASLSWTTPILRARARAASGKLDTRRLDAMEASSHLAETQFALNRLVEFEGPGLRRPIAGNASVDWVRSTFSSRFRGDTQNVNAAWKYSGGVSGGPNDGRKVVGLVRLVVRQAPPAMALEQATSR